MKCLMFIFTMLMTCLVWAQEAIPETVEGAVGFIPKLLESIAKGEWIVTGGIVLMVVMVAVRQFLLPKWNITGDGLEAINMGIAAVGSVGLMMATGVDNTSILLNALFTALISKGAWDILGKFLFKKLLGESYQAPAPKE